MIHSEKYTISGPGINQHYELKDFYMVSYLLETFSRFTMDKHLTALELQKEGKSWIVSEIKVELFEKPLVWMNDIEVELTFRSSQSIKVLCDYNITHKGKTVGQATMQWVVIDQIKHRPIAHPKVAEKCTEEENTLYRQFRFPKLTEVKNKTSFTQKINSSVLDFNNHLSTYHYFRYAYDALDAQFTKEHYPAIFQAKFEKEVHLGKTIVAYTETENNISNIELKEQDDNEEYSVFKLKVEWKKR